MAQFPLSAKTFTPRANGQTIDASHLNDLQDEVTALEDGYLNGTARLNASNSTVASLSVSGGSTLAGALSVAGGSTFAVRPVMPPPDAVRVSLTSTVAMPDGAPATLNWGNQVYMTNSSLHSTAVNSSRLTPQSTGIYTLTGQVGFAATSSGLRQVSIRDSSGAVLGLFECTPSNASALRLQVNASQRVDVIGGWFTMQVFQSGGSTLSLSTGISDTWFEMRKL